MSNKYQKYFPYILIAATILIGGFLLVKRGIISLPFFGKKENVVDIGKKSVVDLLFSQDEYKLSYNQMSPAGFVNIAKFGKGEQWQGEGSIEESKELELTVLSLIDRDRQKATSYLVKDFNLSAIDNIKLVVNLKSVSDNLESLNLLFGNKEGTSFFRFPLTNLEEGVNYLTIPKYRFFQVGAEKIEAKKEATYEASQQTTVGWDTIGRVQFELISRPQSKASVDIAWIRGEKEDAFTSDWNWDQEEHFLNLDLTSDGKLALLVQNVGRSVGTLRKVGSVKDFNYSAKITTIRKGHIGLFVRGDYKSGYGYYLAVGGEGTSDWSISKYGLVDKQPKSVVLLDGQIGNFEFSLDQPFWLKVEASGNTISAYFSLDGEKYTKLGEVTDNEFGAGGIGIATASGGTGYFDDFSLAKK